MLRVNEIFYSLQGEGVRTGTPNVFVRFSGCNLECTLEAGPRSPGGFDCDTEFVSGRNLTLKQLLEEMADAAPPPGWCVLTGGEPGLQIDDALVGALHAHGWKVAVETNGTIVLPDAIDWITVSPKVAEHKVQQLQAHEVKYVRGYGQKIPKPRCRAEHKLISPAFIGNEIDQHALAWCIQLVKENPTWRLSTQQHKAWKVR